MNLLIDRPPETVFIKGTEYKINSDFRTSVLFELLMQDEDVLIVDKIVKAIELYFPVIPSEEIGDIFDAIEWFYGCGRSDKERKPAQEKEEEGKESKEDEQEEAGRIYSFDYDDEYIYSAFLQQYRINLATIKYLHWWEFRAMFKGLDHSCEFVKIMEYRATKITSEMSKQEKKFLRKMKSIHALPISEKEYKERNTLINALKNGDSIDGLLGHGDVLDG